ncbi:MAG: ATP-binding cassette domain-containing protein [Bacteroidetes bacterium]|nr:ATP-binding cassette domain-containing protein [Bacteroidota bacterium]MCH8525511.1 ATP-binding cassette domain-containing protein [Balneolales bacterium]
MSVIQVQQVSKSFENTHAVKNVSFDIPKGSIYGILGPNGAGKTTTIRMINYITIPDTGQILINGRKASAQTQREIGYLPEERGLYKKMKVGEQLMYLAQLKGMRKEEARNSIKGWLDRFDATGWIGKEVGELSKGMQQKVQFISTVAHNPDIYIFDEPFSGLDPINSELLRDVILELKSEGKTILFSTHRMEQVEQMCDFICLYRNGENVLNGNLTSIKQSFGKNTIILEFDGDHSFLSGMQDVRFNNKSNRSVEIIPDAGVNPQDLLVYAASHVTVNRFELIYPSLQEIFIQTVKQHVS